jgi:addiction module RelB/DinJ family antitoxin
LDTQHTAQLADVENVRYTRDMSRIVRSAMLQMRVTPEIKFATEHVLRRIGLNLTEATELFFRRMIIDQRLPFDVVALDNAAYTQLLLDWEEESRSIAMKHDRHLLGVASRSRGHSKRE